MALLPKPEALIFCFLEVKNHVMKIYALIVRFFLKYEGIFTIISAIVLCSYGYMSYN